MSGSLCRVRIFISNLLRATIYIFINLQHRPFILRYGLFESDGCRIIYLISQGPSPEYMYIYFKVYDARIFILKNASTPPQNQMFVPCLAQPIPNRYGFRLYTPLKNIIIIHAFLGQLLEFGAQQQHLKNAMKFISKLVLNYAYQYGFV